MLERELVGCERRGQEWARAAILCELADIELRAGNWSLAGSYLDDALGVQIDGQDLSGQALTRSAQALLAAHRGDVAEARRLAGDAIAVGQEYGWEEFVARNRWILGFVEFSLGEPRQAWTLLEGLPERLRRIGVGEPGHVPALPDVVETLTALGRLDDAEAVLVELEAQAHALQHRWATPAAGRCRAVLALAVASPSVPWTWPTRLLPGSKRRDSHSTAAARSSPPVTRCVASVSGDTPARGSRRPTGSLKVSERDCGTSAPSANCGAPHRGPAGTKS